MTDAQTARFKDLKAAKKRTPQEDAFLEALTNLEDREKELAEAEANNPGAVANAKVAVNAALEVVEGFEETEAAA